MQRGDVYELRPPRRTGHEPQGRRLGVVVQADALLPRSVVLVAPTSLSARAASVRPEVVIEGEPTRVPVEHRRRRCQPPRRPRRIGKSEEMWRIDECLMTVFGLH
ncbi:MAG: type II toxin-antitoxin system PemK/MazF family toxin [Acidimicrobiales bacterium]